MMGGGLIRYGVALVSCVACLGCSPKIDDLARMMGVGLDPHESLYSQMLACQERFCDILATTNDLESINKARPQMKAEAEKYRELGKRFLATKGLTPEKLKGIIDRSRARRQAINTRMKDEFQRLMGGTYNPEISLAIPQLELSGYELNFIFDAAEVAAGKKSRWRDEPALIPPGGGPPPPPPPLEPQVSERLDRHKRQVESARAKMEAARAEMEAKRAEIEARLGKIPLPPWEESGRKAPFPRRGPPGAGPENGAAP